MFLFGAEFTEVYATRYGSEILPSDNAVAFEVILGQEEEADSPAAPSTEGTEHPQDEPKKETEPGSSPPK